MHLNLSNFEEVRMGGGSDGAALTGDLPSLVHTGQLVGGGVDLSDLHLVLRQRPCLV